MCRQAYTALRNEQNINLCNIMVEMHAIMWATRHATFTVTEDQIMSAAAEDGQKGTSQPTLREHSKCMSGYLIRGHSLNGQEFQL